jgi:pimeloyl-ACP methyl ester carboxylesterase
MTIRTPVCLCLCWASLVVLPISIPAQTVGADRSPSPIGKLIDIGGYRVHLYCMGEGSPTVVIVGAGYSFDWGLIQPEVAKFTEVCTYDHSGIGWSDDGPKDSCVLRVNEVHVALKNAGIKGPYVLVGHSLGALVARLYAAQYPNEVAGIVFVDHAAIIGPNTAMRPGMTLPPPPPNGSTTTPPSRVRIVMEDDPNFHRLPSQDRELHVWFSGQARDQEALHANGMMMPECFAEADAISKKNSYPLGDKPLVDVDTPESAGLELQSQFLKNG